MSHPRLDSVPELSAAMATEVATSGMAVFAFAAPTPGWLHGQSLVGVTRLAMELLADGVNSSRLDTRLIGQWMRRDLSRNLIRAVAESHTDNRHPEPVWCCPDCTGRPSPFPDLFGVDLNPAPVPAKVKAKAKATPAR